MMHPLPVADIPVVGDVLELINEPFKERNSRDRKPCTRAPEHFYWYHHFSTRTKMPECVCLFSENPHVCSMWKFQWNSIQVAAAIFENLSASIVAISLSYACHQVEFRRRAIQPRRCHFGSLWTFRRSFDWRLNGRFVENKKRVVEFCKTTEVINIWLKGEGGGVAKWR